MCELCMQIHIEKQYDAATARTPPMFIQHFTQLEILAHRSRTHEKMTTITSTKNGSSNASF